jgi:hypothetical protein
MPDVGPTSTIVRTAEAVTVSIRRRWSDPWTAAPWLFCNYYEFGVAPKIQSAGFSYRYGLDRYPGDEDWTEYALQDLDDWHVKVEIEQDDNDDGPVPPWTWYGQFHEIGTTPEGYRPRGPAGGRVPCGSVDLVATDYLALLDGDPIIQSWYAGEGGEPQWLGVALPFNARNQRGDRGNRSSQLARNGIYLFAGALDTAADCAWWSTRDIVKYLLQMHAPVDPAGNLVWEVRVAGDRLKFLPDWDRPAIGLHGQTVKAVLDQLLSPHRLLGYWVGPNAENNPTLYPFTFLDVAIPVSDRGDMFPANTDQVSLDLSLARDVSNPILKNSTTNYYDQVVLLGQRVVCCGTISSRQWWRNLVGKWTDEERDRYNDGASNQANYPEETEPALRDHANKEARSREVNARVYKHFGLPDNWNGVVGDGQTVYTPGEVLFPYAEFGLQGSLEDHGAVWYRPLMKFSHHLPLVDEDASRLKRAVEYRKPYVLVRDPYGPAVASPSDERYAEIEKLGERMLLESALDSTVADGPHENWSASVQAHEHEPTLVLNVTGAEQHVLAKGEFTPCDETDLDIAEYDWRDNIMATVAMEAFYRASASYPVNVAGVNRDVLHRKVIEFDKREDQGRAWWIAGGTVIGLGADQKPIRCPAGQFLQDDRPYMRILARMAFEWFGRARQTISFTYGSAQRLFSLGQLVMEVKDSAVAGPGDFIVRTVVTEVRVEFGQHMEEPHRTHVSTSWGELDVLQFG